MNETHILPSWLTSETVLCLQLRHLPHSDSPGKHKNLNHITIRISQDAVSIIIKTTTLTSTVYQQIHKL